MDQSDFDEIMKIQKMMLENVAQEQQTDNKIKMMDIINDLVGAGSTVQKEAVLIEAQSEGFTEQQVLKILEELKNDHFLIESGGYLRKI